MAKTTDELVLELVRKVKERKAEIQSLGRPNWLTSCTLGYNPDSVADRINIQTVTQSARIAELYTFLLAKEEYWQEALKDLDLDMEPVYMGYPISSWKADLKFRASQINIDKKKKELETLEKRLDGLITVEQRRVIELAEIEKELAKS